MQNPLGTKIKQARKKAGLSQKELAKGLYVSDKTISAYEVGRAKPNFEQMQQLSSVLQQPISFFDSAYKASEENTDLRVKLDDIEKQLAEIKRELYKRNS